MKEYYSDILFVLIDKACLKISVQSYASRKWWHAPLFKASLCYTRLNLSKKRKWNSHKGVPSTQESKDFNLSTRGIETGVIWRREVYKVGENKSSLQSEV